VDCCINRDKNKHELWKVKLLPQMRLQNETRYLCEVIQNADAFGELVQCLDDRSLLLVIRKAKEKGLVRRKNIKRTREAENSRGKNIKIIRKNSSWEE
jgi:hypothetical protein